MKSLIDSILNKDYVTADSIVAEEFESIMRSKLLEAKKRTAAKMCEMDVSREKPEHDDIIDVRPTQKPEQEGKGDKEKPKETVITKNNLKEEELTEARVKILKARIRGGKVQRRKKISNVKGYKLAGGKLERMSPAERRNRKLGQKRGKMKRKSKMRLALMKRKRSLRKRAAIGL